MGMEHSDYSRAVVTGGMEGQWCTVVYSGDRAARCCAQCAGGLLRPREVEALHRAAVLTLALALLNAPLATASCAFASSTAARAALTAVVLLTVLLTALMALPIASIWFSSWLSTCCLNTVLTA